MDLNKFKSWLFTDAGAGWTFGIVTVVLFIVDKVLNHIKRKKPNILICKEVDKFTLIRISKKVKDKTSISYKNKLIKNLAQIELEVFNNGTETVKNVKIILSFSKSTKILDVVSNKTLDIEGTRNISDNEMTVNFPFLNAYNEHKSKINLSIVCDGDIENFNITGGGEGWSLTHIRLLPINKSLIRMYILITLIFIELIVFGLLGRNVLEVPKQKGIEFFAFNIIFFITYFGGLYWAIHSSPVYRRLIEIFMSIFNPILKKKLKKE